MDFRVTPGEKVNLKKWPTKVKPFYESKKSVFNRSYYEEVLIVRVHPEILGGQGLPEALLDEKTIWKGRYHSIVDLEEHLHRNGTRLIKIFLHQSKDEQRKRFLNPQDAGEIAPGTFQNQKGISAIGSNGDYTPWRRCRRRRRLKR